MLASFFRIIALTRKELLAVLMDPRARFSLLIPPILQCLIFGYAASYDLNDVPYAVLDQDRSAASRELLAGLDGSGVFHRMANLDNLQSLTDCINQKRALLVIQIDHDFARRLQAGQPANIQLIADGRNSNTAGTATLYVGAVVNTFNINWRASHGQAAPKVSVINRVWYNPNLETRWAMIPALIGTLTMMQTLILTAMSIAREREQGTFDQLLVSPFHPFEIMAGKALPCMLIGAVMATSILLVAWLWFRIPFAGSLLTLYTGLILFLLAAVGIGLFVSSIAATMQQALLYSFLVMIPFMLLSGLATPVSSMPQSVQYFTLINPLRYAIEIAQQVYLEGAGIGRLWPDLWPMAIIATVTLTAAAGMFRHRLE
jgi:ABC-2 type transport system permease protein